MTSWILVQKYTLSEQKPSYDCEHSQTAVSPGRHDCWLFWWLITPHGFVRVWSRNWTGFKISNFHRTQEIMIVDSLANITNPCVIWCLPRDSFLWAYLFSAVSQSVVSLSALRFGQHSVGFQRWNQDLAHWVLVRRPGTKTYWWQVLESRWD